jgi:NAD(P) transhydrogenase
MADYDYDMLVIGSGPAGQRAAIQAAKLDKRVAIVERKDTVGGAAVNVGTIPSKTLREAVLYLSGYRERGLYGDAYVVKRDVRLADLLVRTDYVTRHEGDVTLNQIMRNRIELLAADASFIDPHSLHLTYIDGRGHRDVTADKIVIATGTSATRPDNVPIDGIQIFTSDDILDLDRLPRTLTVVGAGVIGCEFTSIFATLGVRVTLIDKYPRMLTFVDSEIVESLVYHMRQNRVILRLGEEVERIEAVDDGKGDRVRIHLASGKQIVSEKALYSIGRTGSTNGLNLPAAGLEPDDRGRISVNDFFQTDTPNIYGAGDVVGFPSLASTSMEQGRIAACHAFNIETNLMPELFPYGIYTIPEISTVGLNEEELTKQGVPYEVGKAQYREIARGQIIGDRTGLLKLIFHLETHALLGVHIIGEGASELVHIGQAVLAYGGKVDYFLDTVFNYPTLAECYKTAAFDEINRLSV